MHTNTAIVATEILEVAKVVRKWDIGTVVHPFGVKELSNTINDLLNDSERLSTYKSNCEKAAESENWESETAILQEIYPKVE